VNVFILLYFVLCTYTQTQGGTTPLCGQYICFLYMSCSNHETKGRNFIIYICSYVRHRLGKAIQIYPLPSTHSRLPQHAEKAGIGENILRPAAYIFLCANYRAQQAQEQNKANIDDVLFIEHVIQSTPSQSIPSRPHSNAEKGGQGVIISYLPKYIFCLPQFAPQPARK
jgi:hypothetical protein